MSHLVSVTLAGVDDAVDPLELIQLSREFPFVEWGVLMSQTRAGSPRYPSLEWIEQLAAIARVTRIASTTMPEIQRVRLSAHLCGSWSRSLADGVFSAPVDDGFDRIQVNGYEAGWLRGISSLSGDPLRDVEWILQARTPDRVTECMHEAAILPRGSVLFDGSCGTGVEPAVWPRIVDGARLGYAGGIKPTNVRRVLGEILFANAMGRPESPPFWIDLESGARTLADRFSVHAAYEVLDVVAKINAAALR